MPERGPPPEGPPDALRWRARRRWGRITPMGWLIFAVSLLTVAAIDGWLTRRRAQRKSEGPPR